MQEADARPLSSGVTAGATARMADSLHCIAGSAMALYRFERNDFQSVLTRPILFHPPTDESACSVHSDSADGSHFPLGANSILE
jgi:hypothetical protein